MKTTVSLFGEMKKYADKDRFQLELEDGSTVAHLLDHLKIEDRIYIVVLIDGRRVYEEEPIPNGAEVILMTPTGGG
ncbi:MAG: MoaD/ThiS family protein [Bacillota bacterium]|jgi:molybdopterin converting factor small subunit|nr:MoaD/ThiS family protein [Bacillota bacterium]MDI9415558.1 MoaD/ThiS family protein [Bacillota bacterium]NLD12403.1 MoaD/ThiS family protein [Bacillota bacterium]HAV20435.1 molybdopterin synthase sulfur carrier subunit [Bacillota bacterium]HOB89133.1 MoaD/ThiS family protein [Bacillota bacterium]